MKPKFLNSIFRRLFRQAVPEAKDLKHHAEAWRKVEFLGDNAHEPCVIHTLGSPRPHPVDNLSMGSVIHTLGSPPEHVVAAFVANHRGDPSMLDELVKEGYVVGAFKELGEIFHRMSLRGSGFADKLQLAANEAETMLANAADGGSPFAILQADSFLVPYGEFPHKMGLQHFDRAAAEEMVAAHNSALSRLARWARGEKASYPVYVGHPDLPGSKDTDKRAYGWIEDMIAENDGLRLTVKWSDAGRKLVENAHFKFYSPLWWTRKLKTGGIRPVGLKSMGLTNDPNIPVPALANEAEEEIEDHGSEIEEEQPPSTIHNPQSTITPTKNNEPMNPEILAALGLEEGATPEEVLAKITALKDAAAEAETLKAEKETSDADKAAAEAEKLKAEEEKTAAENERDAANVKLAVAANAAVAAAVSAGRITPADAEGKTAEILAANDFEAALGELGKLPAKFKTESQTGDLGSAKSRLVIAANDESAAARDERARLVANEFENTDRTLSVGERKRIAWRRAQAKNPEAFGKKESSGTAA